MATLTYFEIIIIPKHESVPGSGDGSVGKAFKPEFDPSDSHGGIREGTPQVIFRPPYVPPINKQTNN